MARKILIYWRDIPSQVLIQRGRVREKCLLSNRFQEAIDRAAMRAGKGSSDAYLAEWRREACNCDPGENLQEFASQQAQLIESEYPHDRLLQLIRAHGLEVNPLKGNQT
jgi:hypothetical protein